MRVFRKIAAAFLTITMVFSVNSWAQASQHDTSIEQSKHTLLLVDLTGCPDCIAWKRQVQKAYVASDLAQAAPLAQVEVRSLAESDYWHLEKPTVFPTFILLDAQNEEIDRITGYAGPDFFWGYLDTIYRKHDIL